MPAAFRAHRSVPAVATAVFASLATFATALAQQPPAPPPREYFVGNPGVGLPVAPAAPGQPAAAFAPASRNVRLFGALYAVESCSYDPVRGVIVAPSRGVPQALRTNDAWIALINHDGSVHTPRWIGVQNSGAERDNMRPPLVLNEPLGSIVHKNVLYLADRDGGTPDPARPGQNLPTVAVVRSFDMTTGRPLKSLPVPGSTGLNDIAVAADGTVYGTNSGTAGQPDTWVVWKVTANGEASVFTRGAPMNTPNGIEVDGDGNIVVVNIGSADVVTYSPDARVLRTEQAVQPGNDGLVLMPDGVKFVSSVTQGGISMIVPGKPARLIAENIPSGASMCYDPAANQLVVPVNANNGLAFVPLKGIYKPKRQAKR